MPYHCLLSPVMKTGRATSAQPATTFYSPYSFPVKLKSHCSRRSQPVSKPAIHLISYSQSCPLAVSADMIATASLINCVMLLSFGACCIGQPTYSPVLTVSYPALNASDITPKLGNTGRLVSLVLNACLAAVVMLTSYPMVETI